MDRNKLREIIEKSNNIVFFGGAGVSTESNIPDFRSEAGLYKTKENYKYTPEEMLSHSFFMNNTEDFFDFYKSKMIYRNAKSNAAHFALAELEERGKLKAVITQNIDGLHQAAGSKNVLELHGSVHRNHCTICGEFYNLDFMINSQGIPKCKCGGTIKPNVVLYEEALDNEVLEASIDYISKAEVLIIGGTSLTVYPAAGLIRYYKGSNLVLINKTTTAYDSYANLVIKNSIGDTLKEAVD